MTEEETPKLSRRFRWHIGHTVAVFWLAVVAVGNPLACRPFKEARQANHNFCLNQLTQIDAAKLQTAMQLKWTNGTPVVTGDSNVNMYIKGLAGTTNILRCPGGGRYTYNPMGVDPTCTIKEHVLAGP